MVVSKEFIEFSWMVALGGLESDGWLVGIKNIDTF